MRTAHVPRSQRPQHPTREARLLQALITAVAITAPRAANAAPNEKCFSAYEEAQASRKRDKLVQSKADLQACVSLCPGSLAVDCQRWLEEIERDVPKLTVHAEGTSGEAMAFVNVLVDGKRQTADTEIELDPGDHAIRVEAPSHAPTERKVMLAKGARVRETITLAKTTDANAGEKPAPEQPSRAAPIALLAGGGALLLAGSVLSIIGWADVAAMRGSCAPAAGGAGCPSDRIDRVRTEWTVGAALAASGGAIALGAGIWLGVTRPKATSPTSRGALSIGFHPSPLGGTIDLVGSF